MKLREAQGIAEELKRRFEPHCRTVTVAGSIRRCRAEVGDIELVGIPEIHPVVETDVCGTVVDGQALPVIEAILSDKELTILKGFDPARRVRWPRPKYVQMMYRDLIKVDLFLPTVECWAAVLAIRTGSSEFSHALMKQAQQRGLKQEKGRLCRPVGDNNWEPIEVGTEADYFRWLGVPWVEPPLREPGKWQEKAPDLKE